MSWIVEELRERWKLWLAAFVFYVVGDIATTIYGIQGGAQEKNPILAPYVHDQNVMVMFMVKLAIVGVALVGVRVTRSDRFNWAFPGSIGLVGLAVVLWNLFIISSLS